MKFDYPIRHNSFTMMNIDLYFLIAKQYKFTIRNQVSFAISGLPTILGPVAFNTQEALRKEL